MSRLARKVEPDWMQIKITIPQDEGREIMDELHRRGFVQLDDDWCTEKRTRDNATVDYAPAPPPPDRKAAW